MAGLTSVTIGWVACCGTPTWVTGLSILGLNYSTALLLKPFGALIMLLACACLLAA